jgi:hypothetical protein
MMDTKMTLDELRKIAERFSEYAARFTGDGLQPDIYGTLSEQLHAAADAWVADRDLLELAWGIIANAGGGDWSTQTQEWQDAAVRWRERWFAALAGEKP